MNTLAWIASSSLRVQLAVAAAIFFKGNCLITFTVQFMDIRVVVAFHPGFPKTSRKILGIPKWTHGPMGQFFRNDRLEATITKVDTSPDLEALARFGENSHSVSTVFLREAPHGLQFLPLIHRGGAGRTRVVHDSTYQ